MLVQYEREPRKPDEISLAKAVVGVGKALSGRHSTQSVLESKHGKVGRHKSGHPVRNALIGTAALGIGIMTFNGCVDNKAYEERVRQEQVEAQRRIEDLYANAQIVAKYSVPFLDIKSKKNSYNLDPFTHLENEAKAQTIRLPVSEDYFSSVSVGQKIESKFNTGGFFLRGEFESYSITISDKIRDDVFFVRTASGWEDVSLSQYNQLFLLNNEKKEYHTQGDHEGVLIRDNISEEIASEAIQTCKIIIESRKSNITLDVGQHLENAWNKMRYPIEVPKFFGDRLKVGSDFDHNFVGGSLFFSRSPSIVSYRVLEKTCG